MTGNCASLQYVMVNSKYENGFFLRYEHKQHVKKFETRIEGFLIIR